MNNTILEALEPFHKYLEVIFCKYELNPQEVLTGGLIGRLEEYIEDYLYEQGWIPCQCEDCQRNPNWVDEDEC